MSDDRRVHHYRTHLAWTGSTGVGYDDYDRDHRVEIIGSPVSFTMSADPAFRGDPSLCNPEQLVVVAAASCQCLSFLAVAARARLDVVDYHDDATGEMAEDDAPVRITRITLRPRIILRDGVRPRAGDTRLRRLVEIAHSECYIANSLRSEIVIEPTFSWVAAVA